MYQIKFSSGEKKSQKLSFTDSFLPAVLYSEFVENNIYKSVPSARMALHSKRKLISEAVRVSII